MKYSVLTGPAWRIIVYFQERAPRTGEMDEEAISERAAAEFPKGASCGMVRERLNLGLGLPALGQLLTKQCWCYSKVRGATIRLPPEQ